MASKGSKKEDTCWAWVGEMEDLKEGTDKTFAAMKAAYRLDVSPCPSGTCKRNCKGNVYCLGGLGEKGWQKEPTFKRERMPAELLVRDMNTEFVGLKNAGATCYINTFLQVLSSSRSFCEVIFRWNRERAFSYAVHDPTMDCDLVISICAALQDVFARLHLSTRKFVDPSVFVGLLNLDPDVQQDCMEFSKLLMCNLEAGLKADPTLVREGFYRQQVCGTLNYITQCLRCKSETTSSSEFFEIVFPFEKSCSLQACIEQYVLDEKLDGENMYSCSVCGTKEEAVRKTSLSNLPRTLNLNVMRYKFDRVKFQKKKVMYQLSFPDVLDMAPYVKNSGTEPTTYRLSAVLLHHGSGASVGHYVAHIRRDGDWYSFNDDLVEKGNGPLKLDESGSKSGKEKNFHTSKNVYMMVYERETGTGAQSESTTSLADMIPPELVEGIVEDNEKLQQSAAKWDQEQSLMETSFVEDHHDMLASHSALILDQDTINDCLLDHHPKHLPPPQTDKSSRRSTGAPIKRLNGAKTDGTSVTRKPTRKTISRASPTIGVKAESPSTVDIPMETGSEEASSPLGSAGLSLGKPECGETTCKSPDTVASGDGSMQFVSVAWLSSWLKNPKKCGKVTNQVAVCRHHRLNVMEMGKVKCVRASQMKKLYAKYTGGPYLDMGSLCFPCVLEQFKIKKLYLQIASLTRCLKPADYTPGESKASGFLVGSQSLRQWKRWALLLLKTEQGTATKEEQTSVQSLNEDIACEHGRLQPKASKKLLPASQWEKLTKIFNGRFMVFSSETEPCEQCLNELAKQEVADSKAELEAAGEKKTLIGLFGLRSRPKISDMCPDSSIYVVSLSAYMGWKAYVKVPARNTFSNVINEPMMCMHDMMLFDPIQDNGVRSILLTDEEWAILISRYPSDFTVTLQHDIESIKGYSVQPAVCPSCSVEDPRTLDLTYARAKVFVRKVSLVATGDSSPQTAEGDDFDFVRKERKVADGSGAGGDNSTHSLTPTASVNDNRAIGCDVKESPGGTLPTTSTPRKSQRVKKSRRDKVCMVACTTTLKELKIKIFEAYQVAPFDQTIYMDKRKLEGDELTLAELKVTPDTLLTLECDEPAEGATHDVDSGQPDQEMGFAGTSLLRFGH